MNLQDDEAARTECVRQLVAQYRTQAGALLPLLHAIQDALGYVPASSVPLVAQGLSLSRAEVHGVLTYYHHFRSEPPGRRVVQVCRAEACQACGADDLLAHAEQTLGCRVGSTRDDGEVSLEAVYCLGLCASSPAIAVNEQPMARMTPQRLTQLTQQWGLSAEAVAPQGASS